MTAVFIIIILLVIYAAIENKFILLIRREQIKDDGVKIVHIGDLHHRRIGRNNSRLLRAVSKEKPDIIIISGDLVSRDCTDFSNVSETLKGLMKIAQVYLVTGNHEADLSPEYFSELEKVISDSGAVLLRNKTISVEIRGRSLNISGLELEQTVYKKNGSYRNLDVPADDEIYRKLGDKSDGENLLIVHNPFFAEYYARWGADYAFCGHVHGGSVRIPFTDIGLLSPERRLFPKYTKGIYTVDKMSLLVTSGIGKARLFNPSEIVVYTI
ncbi:MAG: metallophosphoesterase [Oscillospiraceae bacterium]|nr:metallophosphoesterase [Oscillospiraceae bacterium]